LVKRVFKAFAYRDFRLMWIGACTSSVGTWMQTLAQSWLVLELSQSPFMLGLDAFLGQIPIFLFSLVGGVVADRMDRRHLLLISQFIQLSCAFLLTFLLAVKAVEVWHILALSFMVGTAQAFGGPAYQALIPRLVKGEDLQNAIALNSIQFNLARVIGPVIGGLAMSKLGAVWCFGLNGLSYIAVIISLLMLHERYTPPEKRQSMLESMKEGIQFIRQKESMEALIFLAFFMTAFGIPIINFLPVFAKDVLKGDANTFSLLLSVSGLGSVTGALFVAGIGNVHNKGRVALTSLTGLGAMIVAFSLSTNLYLSCVFLFLSGGLLMASFAMIASLVQLITSDNMRGRVMSVYNVAFRGGMPFGSLAAGKLITMYSAPYVIAANGALLAAMGLWFLVVQRRVAKL